MKITNLLWIVAALGATPALAVCGKAKPNGNYKCCEPGDEGTECCTFDGDDEPISCYLLDSGGNHSYDPPPGHVIVHHG